MPLLPPRVNLDAVDYSYQPFPNSRSIRLLHLAPGTDDTLRCSLSFANLYTPPDYEALSYVWGDPSKKTCIQCDGKSLFIPTSLAVALRRLRDSTSVRTLWADAICINQEHIPERNQQVALMGTVYSSATRVIAWLGADEASAQLAFYLIHRLDLLWPYNHDEVDNIPRLEPDHPIFQDFASWEALAKLVNHPYFKRGWIQQEIGLAKCAVLFCDDFEIPWDLVCRIASNFLFLLEHELILEDKMLLSYPDYIYSTFTFYLTVEKREQVLNRKSVKDPTPHMKDFWEVLYYAKLLQYSDLHDVVYAFLGHPTAWLGEYKTPLVPIDYDKSIYQLYIELAVKGLADLKTPAALSFVSHQGKSINQRLPSWVWDLSTQNDDTYRIDITGKLFQTGMETEMGVSVSRCNTKLFVRGVMFDHVDVCREEFAPLGKYSSERVSRYVSDTLSFVHGEKLPFRYNDMSVELIASLVMVCGKSGLLKAENDVLQHLERFHAYCDQNGIDHVRSALEEEPDTVLRQEAVNQRRAGKFVQNLSSCYGRKVFRTRQGYFGLGPHLMEPGDLVCVLFGFPTPFILRKVDRHYLLIGECHVLGIMNGEVMEKWRNGELEAIYFEIH